MRLSVCTGDDVVAIRAHQRELSAGCEHLPAERLDLTVSGGADLADAIETPSLFAPQRLLIVTGMQALEDSAAKRIAAAAATSDAIVVARSDGAVPASVKKTLGGCADIHSHALPKGRAVQGRIGEISRAAGLKLSGPDLTLLAERAGHDLVRIDTICAQLAAVGLTQPSREQMLTLLGSSAAPGVPWDLSDALENGQLPLMWQSAAHSEPLAVIGYLISRTLQAGQIADVLADGPVSSDQAMTLAGVNHKFVADKLLTLARRLGTLGAARSLEILLEADLAAKSGTDPNEAMTVALGRLVALWAPPAR